MYIKFIISIAMIPVLLIFALQNAEPTKINFLFLSMDLPIVAAIVFSAVLGFLIAMGVFTLQELELKKNLRKKNNDIKKLRKEITLLNNSTFVRDIKNAKEDKTDKVQRQDINEFIKSIESKEEIKKKEIKKDDLKKERSRSANNKKKITGKAESDRKIEKTAVSKDNRSNNIERKNKDGQDGQDRQNQQNTQSKQSKIEPVLNLDEIDLRYSLKEANVSNKENEVPWYMGNHGAEYKKNAAKAKLEINIKKEFEEFLKNDSNNVFDVYQSKQEEMYDNSQEISQEHINSNQKTDQESYLKDNELEQTHIENENIKGTQELAALELESEEIAGKSERKVPQESLEDDDAERFVQDIEAEQIKQPVKSAEAGREEQVEKTVQTEPTSKITKDNNANQPVKDVEKAQANQPEEIVKSKHDDINSEHEMTVQEVQHDEIAQNGRSKRETGSYSKNKRFGIEEVRKLVEKDEIENNKDEFKNFLNIKQNTSQENTLSTESVAKRFNWKSPSDKNSIDSDMKVIQDPADDIKPKRKKKSFLDFIKGE